MSTVPTSPPANPVPGAVYIDKSTNFSYVYTGSGWILTSGSAGYNSQINTGAAILPGFFAKPSPESFATQTGGEPANPGEGQIWVNDTITPSPVYVRHDNAWVKIADGTVTDTTVSAMPPASPDLGDSYYETTTNRFYVWDGSTWQNVTDTADTHSIASATQPAVRSDGSTLQAGDMWVDTNTSAVSYWNGSWFPIAGGSGGSTLSVKEDGTLLTGDASVLNFVGASVTASGTGTEKTITISDPTFKIQEEGVEIASAANSLNFVGNSVTATDSGGGVVAVTIANAAAAINVQEEGVAQADTVNTLNFVGTAVTATTNPSGVATISVASPGTAITLQNEGTPEASTVDTLNFVGTGVTATAAGTTGTIAIDSVLTVQEEGASVATDATTINFKGASVTASSAGSGVIDVDVTGGSVPQATPSVLGTVYADTNIGSTYNTSLGYNAGMSNTASSGASVFVGVGSGSGSTSGNSNTLIGTDSGSQMTTGNSNTIVGYQAGKLLQSSSSSNTFVGRYQGNTSPMSNFVAISDGQEQLRFVANGSGAWGLTPDGTFTLLNYGSAGEVLTSGGSSSPPTWSSPSGGLPLSSNGETLTYSENNWNVFFLADNSVGAPTINFDAAVGSAVIGDEFYVADKFQTASTANITVVLTNYQFIDNTNTKVINTDNGRLHAKYIPDINKWWFKID